VTITLHVSTSAGHPEGGHLKTNEIITKAIEVTHVL